MRSFFENKYDELIVFGSLYAIALLYAAGENFGFAQNSGFPQTIERFSAGGVDAYLFAVGLHFVNLLVVYVMIRLAMRAVR